MSVHGILESSMSIGHISVLQLGPINVHNDISFTVTKRSTILTKTIATLGAMTRQHFYSSFIEYIYMYRRYTQITAMQCDTIFQKDPIDTGDIDILSRRRRG